MKVIPVVSRAKSMAALLKKARQQDLFLSMDEGPEYLLSYIDDFDREVAGTRANKGFMAYLDASRRETKTYSHEEVCRRLGIPPSDPKEVERRAAEIMEQEGPKAIRLERKHRPALSLLDRAATEDVLLRFPDRSEYFVTRVTRGNHEAALERRTVKVGRYLDQLVRRGEIPVIEVFVGGVRLNANGLRDSRLSKNSKQRRKLQKA